MISAATLAELLGDPEKVAELPADMKNQLVIRCAALIAAAAGPMAAPILSPAVTVSEVRDEQPEEDRLLTIPEAAALMNFAASYVYELARKGTIPVVRHKKYVRIQLSDLRAWIAHHRRQGTDVLLSTVLSRKDDRWRGTAVSVSTQVQANRTRRATRRTSDYGEPLGTGDRQDS